MITHRLSTPRTVRLIQTAALDAEKEVVWLACHGYGMSVLDFAEWFEVLPKGHTCLCPEGLSRFYWGKFDGPPVASWMTRAERLSEIADFCAWLDKVYAFAKTAAPDARMVIFGFSQGAATVMRWLNARRPAYDRLVLWSGTPPEDIDYDPQGYYVPHKLFSRWGDADELVPWQQARQRFVEVPVKFQHEAFAGKHRVPREALLALLAALEL